MKPVVWDKNEELKFLQEIASGKSMEIIAKEHDRSASALDLRLKKIIFDNITAGKKEESMAKLLNMPHDKVKQYFYEYKGFLEKKGKLDDVVNDVKTNIGQPVQQPNKPTVITKPAAQQQQPLPQVAAQQQPLPQVAAINNNNIIPTAPTAASKTKPIITNPSNAANIVQPVSKPNNNNNNIVLTGGKNIPSSKPEINKNNKLVDKMLKKNKRIEMENSYMKNVLDNIAMRKKVNKLIDAGVLDKRFKKMFHVMSN